MKFGPAVDNLARCQGLLAPAQRSHDHPGKSRDPQTEDGCNCWCELLRGYCFCFDARPELRPKWFCGRFLENFNSCCCKAVDLYHGSLVALRRVVHHLQDVNEVVRLARKLSLLRYSPLACVTPLHFAGFMI